MWGALLYGYLGGWLLTSIAVALLVRRLRDRKAPAVHPAVWSIVAGAVWPILVLALAEAVAVAVIADAMRENRSEFTLVA